MVFENKFEIAYNESSRLVGAVFAKGDTLKDREGKAVGAGVKDGSHERTVFAVQYQVI